MASKVDTPGKCSPDKSLLEYAYTREIVKRISKELESLGINTHVLVPEETDISLGERVRRANELYSENNKKAILISVHCNAAGNGSQWMNAKGWSVYLSPNASSKSKELATCIAKEAQNKQLKVRKETNDRDYWISNLYICKNTNCPTVLTENMFQDNKEDVEFLLSENGKKIITDIHVKGIIKYLEDK